MQIPARIFINVILRRSEGGSPHGMVKGWRVINGPSDVTKPKEFVLAESVLNLNSAAPYRFLIVIDLFTDGCENKKCELYGECESDSAGEAKCVCPSKCESSVSPHMIPE